MHRPEIGKTIDAGGVKTNYHDMGEGPPVLLVHGSGPGVTAWANWQFTMPALSSSFRLIAPDMLGFGYTDIPSEPIRDKQVWVRHLVDFLDALGLDKVSIIGNSFGGSIAIAFMIAHPDRVDRAVLMGATGVEFPITEALDYVWGYCPSVENMRKSLGYLAADHSRLTDALVQSRYEASIRPGAYEPYAATFGEAPRQRHVGMLASPEAAVAGIWHEVLILHGRDDQVIPLDVSVRLNQLIPRSDLRSFGECGHWVQIERQPSFNHTVATFLSEGLAS